MLHGSILSLSLRLVQFHSEVVQRCDLPNLAIFPHARTHMHMHVLFCGEEILVCLPELVHCVRGAGRVDCSSPNFIWLILPLHMSSGLLWSNLTDPLNHTDPNHTDLLKEGLGSKLLLPFLTFICMIKNSYVNRYKAQEKQTRIEICKTSGSGTW